MTSPELPGDEEQVFQHAAALPRGKRRAYLDSACAGNPQMREAVERLLVPLDDEGFMRQPIAQAAPASIEEEELASPKPEAAGDCFGPYRLLEQIGEGGFGRIWVAEQERPVRRKVALKIIKLGMDTREVIARFEQERQALALMDHPNIAKVYDAGTTPSGRPFFVMELVKAIKITDYCDQARLSTEERLRLFIPVCQAVQHAHQKGIIHRDLKPSNILVTLHDGVPVPKVIDFGVAKATQQQRLSDLTIYTRFEQIIGTPLYMAPEQSDLNGLDIDTRSDIYSLGVLLYELLTGNTPFDPERLMQAGYDEVRRVIREEEPLKPSTALSTMPLEKRSTIAGQRNVEGGKLIRAIQGDLDWIVMKALEKDRNRRYESATGFARDIERHLGNEAVQARPQSTTYRFRRFVQRNKVAFAATTAVLVSILLGLGASTWMFFQERKARNEQTIQRQRSDQVALFLKEMLSNVDPDVALGRDTTFLREILDKTALRLGKELKDQPTVEADLRTVIGNVYGSLADTTHALSMHSEALALREKHLGRENPQVAESLINVGLALYNSGSWSEGEEKIRQALAIQRRLFGSQSVEVAKSLTELALVIRAQGKLSEAESLAREALTTSRKVLGDYNLVVARALIALGQATGWQGKDPKDDPTLVGVDLLDILRKSVGEQHPLYAETLLGGSQHIRLEGRIEEAEPLNRQALAIYQKVYGSTHPIVADAIYNLGALLRMKKDPTEAQRLLTEASAMQRKCFGSGAKETVVPLWRIGMEFEKLGSFTDAEAHFREAISILELRDPTDLFKPQGSLSSFLTDRAWAQMNNAPAGSTSERSPHQLATEAEQLARAALVIVEENAAAPPWYADVLRCRLSAAIAAVAATNTSLARQDRDAKFREGEQLLLSSFERLESGTGVSYDKFFDAFRSLTRFYEFWEKPEQVIRWQKKSVEFETALRTRTLPNK